MSAARAARRRPRRTLDTFAAPKTPEQLAAYAVCKAVYHGRCACEGRHADPCGTMLSAAKCALNVFNREKPE